jgi:hypothetical protein
MPALPWSGEEQAHKSASLRLNHFAISSAEAEHALWDRTKR